MTVPYGTRSLYISCSDDKQFGGIRRLIHKLGGQHGAHPFDWKGGHLDLAGRRVLQRVLISGHGNGDSAGFELSSARSLRPCSLSLPRRTGLYLMGCYQGGKRRRLAWAAGTGVAADRVFGNGGETESALSTCLLLHLLEGGPASLDRWFCLWMRCNDAARPYFPIIRSTYARTGADPLAALAQLKAEGALDDVFREFADFLSVIQRQPAYLADLA
ncbi:MAG: hypothetical protein JSV89_18250 [Spirochaetaceae bacterium]|nr:MAG: hypothetical protein JSV89_18250 [Spirochaetaceae bacterium]